MRSVSSETASRRATYTALSSLFVAAFGFLTTRKANGLKDGLGPFDIAKLGFATYRLGRMIAYDRVFEVYRSPFTETVPDGSGAGLTVEPKGEGAQRAIGELISCPICVGTWVAAGMVFGLKFVPGPARTFLDIMSSVGVAELLNSLNESLEWKGQVDRECAGSMRSGKQMPTGRDY
jgi:hypothetical protein